ncbi:hypothetical protein Q3G72_007221 [Acer saccharum]|nr:hypothetical protein Q3G72_007221 [Acer saccharum]
MMVSHTLLARQAVIAIRRGMLALYTGLAAALINESATSKSVYFEHCRNACYGEELAKGKLTLDLGDNIKGKGTIQGVPITGNSSSFKG